MKLDDIRGSAGGAVSAVKKAYTRKPDGGGSNTGREERSLFGWFVVPLLKSAPADASIEAAGGLQDVKEGAVFVLHHPLLRNRESKN